MVCHFSLLLHTQSIQWVLSCSFFNIEWNSHHHKLGIYLHFYLPVQHISVRFKNTHSDCDDRKSKGGSWYSRSHPSLNSRYVVFPNLKVLAIHCLMPILKCLPWCHDNFFLNVFNDWLVVVNMGEAFVELWVRDEAREAPNFFISFISKIFILRWIVLPCFSLFPQNLFVRKMCEDFCQCVQMCVPMFMKSYVLRV